MGCTCSNQDTSKVSEPNIYNHSQISADLNNTRIDQISYVDLLGKGTSTHYPSSAGAWFRVTKIQKDTISQALIAFKIKKEYETVSSVLALLSHKDPSTLTTINPNSVNDTPQLHIPSEFLQSPTNANFTSYTNEKGYCKVLHLINHGSLKKSKRGRDVGNDASFAYFVQTNCLEGHDLFDHIELSTRYIPNPFTTSVIDMNSARKILKDILYAVKYLHDRNIVHRNIKPGNLKFNVDKDEMKKLMNRDENSDYTTNPDECNLVLIGYANAYCFDTSEFELSDNNNNINDNDNDIEAKWKEMTSGDLRHNWYITLLFT